MPRYFIDTDDDVLAVRDQTGQDFPDRWAARDAAHRVLPDMVRQTVPDGERRTFSARVRDETGTVLYVATLSFVGAWTVAPPPP